MDGTVLRSQSSQSLNGLSVVIPCYNENPMIVATLYTELTAQGAEVIVVDDGNSMQMPDNMPYVTYPAHMGYGYAIKQGIRKATNPIVCSMDADFQHRSEDVYKLYTIYKLIKDCKMVVGQRWGLKEKTTRVLGRKGLNFIASILSKHYLPDLNSGMRVFDRQLALNYEPILCDTFSFTTSMTMSFVSDGHKFAYMPIEVRDRIHGNSHVRVVKDGLVTLWYILWIGVALRTRGIRGWLRRYL